MSEQPHDSGEDFEQELSKLFGAVLNDTRRRYPEGIHPTGSGAEHLALVGRSPDAPTDLQSSGLVDIVFPGDQNAQSLPSATFRFRTGAVNQTLTYTARGRMYSVQRKIESGTGEQAVERDEPLAEDYLTLISRAIGWVAMLHPQVPTVPEVTGKAGSAADVPGQRRWFGFGPPRKRIRP